MSEHEAKFEAWYAQAALDGHNKSVLWQAFCGGMACGVEDSARVCDRYCEPEEHNTKEYCADTADELAARIRSLWAEGRP